MIIIITLFLILFLLLSLLLLLLLSLLILLAISMLSATGYIFSMLSLGLFTPECC